MAPRIRLDGPFVPTAIAFVVGVLVGAAALRVIETIAARPPTPGGGVAAPAPPLAFVRSASGAIEALAPGSDEWSPVEAGATTAAGGEVRTPPGSTAVVILRAAGRLLLTESTHIRFLEPEIDPATGNRIAAIRLLLLDGSFRLERAADAEARIQIEVGDSHVELTQGGRMLMSGGSKSGHYLASFLDAQGQVVGRAGEILVVPENYGVVISGDEVGTPERLPDPPRAVNEEARTRIYTGANPNTPLAIVFAEATDQPKRLLVARDPELVDLVADITDRGSAIELPDALPPGQYYWAAAQQTETQLVGPFDRTRRIDVIAGFRPMQTDEAPSERIVFPAGATGTVFYTRNTPAIGLDWPGLTTEDQYDVALARDSKFRKTVITKQTDESQVTVSQLAAGTYWWRARGPEGKTHTGSFSVRRAAGAVPRERQVNRVTEDYDSAKIIFQRQVPAIEFHWKRDRRVNGGYELKLSKKKDFSKVLVSHRSRTSPIRLPAGTLSEGNWYWRIERVMANGTVLYPGKARQLRVLFDNTVPGLEITSPADGARVTGEEVRVSGLAPHGIKLLVNGAPVDVDAQGRFSTRLPIDPVDPRLVFQTLRGRTLSYYVREISYTSSAKPH